MLINKHIIQTQLLDSPYKMIAADANRSGSITTLDLIQIRRLILNITTEFPNNTSWRFVDASYAFPQPTNPWYATFPEVENFNNLTGAMADADFIAVKIGDVNGSAQANLLGSEERSFRGSFHFEVEEAVLQAGERMKVPVYAADLAQIQGYQYTLEVGEGGQLESVEPGRVEAGHLGLRYQSQGIVTTSWNWEGGRASADYDGQQPLFSVVVKADREVRLSELLRISSRYTAAEAYDQQGALLSPALRFVGQQPTAGAFALYQNVPNPTTDQTVIGFYLPTAEQTTLTIQDGLGRTLKVIQANLGAGYHQYQLSARELGATGVLYYNLKAGSHSASRKMVVVE